MKKNILASFITFMFFIGCSTSNIQDIGAYTNGTMVTKEQMATLKIGKSKKKDVEEKIGYPQNKSKLGKIEIWKYPYSKIRHIGANINETTVFEFNRRGVLIKKYKVQGTAGNPLQ